MAFLERHYSRIGVLATGGPDGTITLRSWNTDATPPGEKAEWQLTVLRTLKVEHDGSRRAVKDATCITAIKFVGSVFISFFTKPASHTHARMIQRIIISRSG